MAVRYQFSDADTKAIRAERKDNTDKRTEGDYPIVNMKMHLFEPDVLILLAPSVYHPTPERLRRRAEKYAADERIHLYVCKSDRRNIGIAAFRVENGAAEILDIAVKCEHRNNGIGSRFVNVILNQFPIDYIIAETDEEAVGFYEKCGFSVEPAEEVHGTKRYLCRLCNKSVD